MQDNLGWDYWAASKQPTERRQAGAMGTNLSRSYAMIAKHGILGEGGANSIYQNASRASGQRRLNLAKSLRKRLGRRLGSRSGRVNALVANQVHAPGIGREAEMLAGLKKFNLTSRLQGLEGGRFVADFLQRNYQYEQDREDRLGADGGWLGTIGDIAGIGADIFSMFPGPQQPAAQAARRVV